MHRRDRLTASILFWAMTLLGGGSLAASLLLPAWLEYRASQRALRAVQQRIARTEYRIRCAQAQLRHLREDPSYIARLAREEFGTPVPGVRTVFVYQSAGQPQHAATAALPAADAAVPQATSPAPGEDLATQLERRIRRDPWLAVFVLPPTRPWVMLFSAGLLVAAWVLLPAARRS